MRHGFSMADIDVGFFRDPKVRRLRGPERDRAVVAYFMIVLASWETGDRMVAEDVLPDDGYDAAVTVLKTGGLLDESGAVPESSWDAWYGAAATRRGQARERQARYRASQSFSDRVPRPS